MGSLLKTSVVVGFLLLLPAVVHCQVLQRFAYVDLFADNNCTLTSELPFIAYFDDGQEPSATFAAFPNNLSETFESAILKNYSDVRTLVACQASLPCNTAGAFQISFNLSDLGACSTAGPPGTQFDTFLLT